MGKKDFGEERFRARLEVLEKKNLRKKNTVFACYSSSLRFGKVKGLERLKIWKRLERLKVLKGRSPRIPNLGHIEIIDNYYSRLDTSNWA